MPYSVSIPQTLATATSRPYCLPPRVTRRETVAGTDAPVLTGAVRSEVLAGPHALDGPATARLLAVRQQRAHVHDALALLARNAGPVVGVRRVRQVLVLLVLPADGLHEVRYPHPGALTRDGALDGELRSEER